VTGWGVGVVFQGAVLTQTLVKALGVRAFTTLANACLAVGLATMGSSHRSGVYIGGVLMTLPGLNGSGANGVRGVATAMAKSEGIRGGDFAAMFNNLRAMVGAVSSAMAGLVYARCVERGVSPGRTYLMLATFAAVVPQVIMQMVRLPGERAVVPSLGPSLGQRELQGNRP